MTSDLDSSIKASTSGKIRFELALAVCLLGWFLVQVPGWPWAGPILGVGAAVWGLVEFVLVRERAVPGESSWVPRKGWPIAALLLLVCSIVPFVVLLNGLEGSPFSSSTVVASLIGLVIACVWLRPKQFRVDELEQRIQWEADATAHFVIILALWFLDGLSRLWPSRTELLAFRGLWLAPLAIRSLSTAIARWHYR